jgi:uncharacterized membrane protein
VHDSSNNGTTTGRALAGRTTEEEPMKKSIHGAVIATAVAAMFLSVPAMAADEPAAEKGVKCVGANACKGTGACGGAGHDCAGKNECKGKGWINTKSAEECTQKGGKVEG